MRQPNDDRGTSRIEAFSDAVIAVAITLLILDVHVPTVQTGLLPALLKQWPTYLGYVTSFLVIVIFWANHHNMFRYIHQVDYPLLIINSFFLMCIVFIPFATAVLTKYITSPTEQHTAAIVYGATLLLNGILFNTIWWYAVWKRRLVRRDLDYFLPINFLRFGRPDIFSVGAQEAPDGHLPPTPAKNELPEVAREPE
jgi:uncharacterized membrane protein